MKKIMFNDRYGLTQAVLEGWKTQTRRFVPKSVHESWWEYSEDERDNDFDKGAYFRKFSPYKVGEIVAVAQCYKEIFPDADFKMVGTEFMTETAGWTNKMFVKADLMPCIIQITSIRVERLQDISDFDCLDEGIIQTHGGYGVEFGENYNVFGKTPFEAFASLIDKVSGKGTWESNPWVYVYEFQLCK